MVLDDVGWADWLVGPGDVEVAERSHLAGVALHATQLGDAMRARLRAAARRQAADRAHAERQVAEVLGALRDGGVRAVVWKGLAVAERWPEPALRPAGDLDLLVDVGELDRAAALLGKFAVAARSESSPFDRLRPTAPGRELWPTAGRTLAIDLQTRPFRTVGSRVDGAALISRARPALIGGAACHVLDPADELLLVMVHAAKHGARAPRWIFDGWALAAMADEVWRVAWSRAVAAEVTRPFVAMTALLASLGVAMPAWLPSPPRGYALLCDAEAARHSRPLTQFERYAAEVLFEPDLGRLAARLLGVGARLFSASVVSALSPTRRPR